MSNFESPIEDLSLIEQIREYVLRENVTHVMCDVFETIVFPQFIFHKNMRRIGLFSNLLRLAYSLVLKVTKAEINQSIVGRIVWRFWVLSGLNSPITDFLPRRIYCELLKDLKSQGIEISLVTNTMLNKSQISEILIKCGLQDFKVYSSREFGVLKSQGLYELCLRNSNHSTASSIIIGDDQLQDIDVGINLGIKTFKVDSISIRLSPILNLRQANLLLGDERSQTLITQFSNLFSHNPTISYAYTAGFFYSGQLAIATARKLEVMVRRFSINDIVFLAREGFLVKQSFDDLVSLDTLQVRTHYLYASRALLLEANGGSFIEKQLKDMSLGKRALFFDVGWRGQFVQAIARFVHPAPRLAMIGIWPWKYRPPRLSVTYFDYLHPFRALMVRRCPEIVEFLLAAPHESVTKSQVIQKSDESTELLIIQGASNSALLDGTVGFQESIAFGLLKLLLSNPNKQQVSLFGDITHSANLEYPVSIVSVSPKGQIFWIKGSRIAGTSHFIDRFNEIKRRFTAVLLK
jgi:Haloacid dehalogenase-like hydrolase